MMFQAGARGTEMNTIETVTALIENGKNCGQKRAAISQCVYILLTFIIGTLRHKNITQCSYKIYKEYPNAVHILISIAKS